LSCVSDFLCPMGSYVALVFGDLPFIHSFQETWGCSLKHNEWGMWEKGTWLKVCCLWSLTSHVHYSRSHMASIGNQKKHGNTLQVTSSSPVRTLISRLQTLPFLAHQLLNNNRGFVYNLWYSLCSHDWNGKNQKLWYRVQFSQTGQVSLPLSMTTHFEVSFKLYLE
jgi:hypothetical protein